MSDLSGTLPVEPDPGTFTERLAQLAQLAARAKDLENQAKQAKDEHQYEQARLFDEMREAGMLTIKTDDAVYSAKSTVYSNVNDKDAFITWAKERGLFEEFLRDEPEKKRLNEFVRNCLDSGEELPPGVNWYAREYISITKN